MNKRMHNYMYIICKQYFNHNLNTYTYTHTHMHVDVNRRRKTQTWIIQLFSFQPASLTFVFVKLFSSEHVFFFIRMLQVIFQHSQKKLRLYSSQSMIKSSMFRAQALSQIGLGFPV